MINPAQCPDYPTYLVLCRKEYEVPADEATFNGWKYPVAKVKPKSLEERVADLEQRMDEWEGEK